MPDYDVVIHRASDEGHSVAANPPVGTRIQLAPDLFVERIDSGVVSKITTTCNAGGAISITPHRYTYVREHRHGDPPHPNFDQDQRLRTTIALSRLIWPTNVGLSQSAQISGDLTDAATLTVRPGPVSGPAAEAYNADISKRNWLTVADGAALQLLQAAYDSRKPPSRVSRALFLHEFGVNTLDGAIRWILMAAALESLVVAGEERVSKQFAARTSAIATELGLGFTKKDAQRAYTNRSKVAHGSRVSLPVAEIELSIGMESLLRSCIHRTISDAAFGAAFDSDDAIRTRWPIDDLATCPNCGRPAKSRGALPLLMAFFKELFGRA